MGKLDPKPTTCNPLKTWDDLNDLLQAGFRACKKGAQPSATFDLNEYDIDEAELKSELEIAGYKIERINGSYYTIV